MSKAHKPHGSPAPATSDHGTPEQQRRALLDAQRKAHRDEPRSVKDDALSDKHLSVEPDGTGPTPTQTFDTDRDRSEGPNRAAGAASPRGKPA